VDTLGEGDMTQAAGYNLMLLIDVRSVQRNPWNPFPWVVVLPEDVTELWSLAVSDLHAWLREQPACMGLDGHLDRDRVVEWVKNNKDSVVWWLGEHSQKHEQIEFVETLNKPMT
jgi:hypothetical protein